MIRLINITSKFIIFILILFLLWFCGRFFKIEMQDLKVCLQRFSILKGAGIFIALYVIVTFFIWLSKDVFRIAAAVIFGANLSTLFIWIAECINAVILFHFSRFMGREFIEKKFFKEKEQRLKERLSSERGFLSLFFFRAVPLVPFRFLDLIMGLSSIDFRKYFLIVMLGSPIRIYWLQYILAAVGSSIFKNPVSLIQYLSSNKIVFFVSLIYAILVIIVAIKLRGKKC